MSEEVPATAISAMDSQLVNIPSQDQLLQAVKDSSFPNPKFNASNSFVFSLPTLLGKIVPLMFKNKPLLIFEGDFFQNFNFAGSFSEVSEAILQISHRIKQKELGKFSYKKLLSGLMEGEQSVMGLFAVFAKKAEQWRNYNMGVKGYLEGLRDGKYSEFEKEGKNKAFEHMAKEQISFSMTGDSMEESLDPESLEIKD